MTWFSLGRFRLPWFSRVLLGLGWLGLVWVGLDLVRLALFRLGLFNFIQFLLAWVELHLVVIC